LCRSGFYQTQSPLLATLRVLRLFSGMSQRPSSLAREKNHLTFLLQSPKPQIASSRSSAYTSILVVGDSYADDADMGFPCWPTLLARSMMLPILNVAHGGSETQHSREQLLRAHNFIKRRELDLKPEEMLLVVHTGGNDVLHALFNPRLLFVLSRDLANFAAYEYNKGAVLPSSAFAEELSWKISTDLDALLGDAASLGHRDVLVSTLPICPAIPLARMLVRMLRPGQPVSFVNLTLTSMSLLLQRNLLTAMQTAAVKYGLRIFQFDEAHHLVQLSSQSDAGAAGVLQTSGLATRKLWQHWLMKPQGPLYDFWHDGHHPGARAHEVLAKRAAEVLLS